MTAAAYAMLAPLAHIAFYFAGVLSIIVIYLTVKRKI